MDESPARKSERAHAGDMKTSSAFRNLSVKAQSNGDTLRSRRSSDQTLLVASGQNESARFPGRSQNSTGQLPQAATLVGLTSSSLLELAIGIDRGFTSALIHMPIAD
jgi:hypothetical protein